jgi:hypothetical protein
MPGMKLVSCARLSCACVFVLAAGPAAAQEATPTPARAEPKVEHLVAEDDGARIEELRVRGQTQRIVVTPKKGGGRYEIVPADGARDMSQDKSRAAAGQRVWHLLNF